MATSPVGAASTTSSFSSQHLASMHWTKITARPDNKNWSFENWVSYMRGFMAFSDKYRHKITINHSGVLPKAARPKGGLFRYHVKRIHLTMQGFGFLSTILMRQNWKRATTTDGEEPPSFNLARFDLNKDCCSKLFTNRLRDYFNHLIAVLSTVF